MGDELDSVVEGRKKYRVVEAIDRALEKENRRWRDTGGLKYEDTDLEILEKLREKAIHDWRNP